MPPPFFAPDELRISRAALRTSACFRLRAMRAATSSAFLGPASRANSAEGWGGSGGGPVPTMGATSACLETVDETRRVEVAVVGAAVANR